MATESSTSTCDVHKHTTLKQLQEIIKTVWPPGVKKPCSPVTQKTVSMLLMCGTEPRDDFNEVYPGLVIGNGTVAQDLEKLTALKVTHVLNAACGPKFNQVPTSADFYHDANIQFFGVNAVDFPRFQLHKHFEESTLFIKSALATGGLVYVHCRQGISRSASLVLAFLLLERDLRLSEALRQVRGRREVAPNEGFLQQLITLDTRLLQQRSEDHSHTVTQNE